MKEIIDNSAKSFGANTAFCYKERKELVEKSYQQLKEDSESFSNVLKSLNMLGEHVAVIGATSYEWIITYFGTVNSNSVIVPVDVQLPAEDLCELFDRADVSILVFDSLRTDVAKMVKEKCPNIKYIISMFAKEDEDGFLSLPKLLEENRGSYSDDINREKMCCILYTSGTTGKSKGVMLSHQSLTDNAVCFDMKIPAGTVSMTILPIHHVYCFTMDILKGLHIGMKICINDSIMHVSRNLKLFKPEIVLLVPLIIESIHTKLVANGGILPKKIVAKSAFGGNLKTVISGGAYLNPDLIKAFKAYGLTILQGYGMTECSPVISTNLFWESKDSSVGKLIPNCTAKIVDEEIWVKGSSVMLGYYKMPNETAEALEDGWLKTGDLGYIDEDDFIYITGRKKNLIILANGENVSPEEIENVIAPSPFIKEIIVKEKETQIHAEIFPDFEYAQKKKIKNIDETLQKAIDTYNSKVPMYKRVVSFSVRDTEFEKTPSKKIKRK